MAGEIAELGISVDSSGVEKAKMSLDDLAQAGGRAENAAQGVGEAWSSVGQKAGSTAGNVDTARKTFTTTNESIRKQGEELGKLLGQIDPVVAALDRLDKQEEKLRGFRATGALDAETFERFNSQIRQNRAALGVFDDSLTRTGNTAKQTQQALRQLPAQFSDIFISLQAGQSPLTVFLQQGAQIKDSFGGVGAALRGVGGALVGLISPLTIAGGAAVALGVAFQQGSQEAVEFNKALILNGNAAGTTADELSDLARAIDGVVGTQRAASSALTQLAASGKIAIDQFELLATAAVAFEQATGQAVADSVAQYEKLAGDPVDAVQKLNESLNFLTPAIFEQIVALERQGRTAEAAAVAQEALARTQIERAADVQENLGYLETATKAATNALSEFWDEAVGFGRAETATQEIDRLQNRLQELSESRSVLGALLSPGSFGASFTTDTGAIEARIQLLKDQQQASTDAAREEARQNEENKRRIAEIAEAEKERQRASEEFARIVESNLTKQQKLESEIANIRKQGQLAGISSAEIDAQVKAAEDRFNESLSRRTRSARTPAIRDDAATRLLLNLREQESALQLQLNTSEKLTAAERERAKFIQQIADLQSKDVLTAEQQSLLAAQDSIKAQLDKNVAIAEEIRLRDEALKLQDRIASVQEAIAAGNQAREDQQADILGAVGLSEQEQEILGSFDRIRREYAKYRAALAEDLDQGALNSEAYADAVAEIEKQLGIALEKQRKYYEDLAELEKDAGKGATKAIQDYIDESNKLGEQTNQLVTKALGGLEDSFVELATTGKTSFRDLADSIIADIIRIGVRATIAEGLSLAGLGTEGGSSAGGLLSAFAGLFGGPRANGGPVSSSRIYEVGENNLPEILQAGGRQYLIPGNDGNVVPSSAMGGGSSVSIGNIVLPGVTNAREARKSGAEVARQINALVGGSARYA
jgi:lambda family phage tail tape measure protein